jgi:hypothetical protein
MIHLAGVLLPRSVYSAQCDFCFGGHLLQMVKISIGIVISGKAVSKQGKKMSH